MKWLNCLISDRNRFLRSPDPHANVFLQLFVTLGSSLAKLDSMKNYGCCPLLFFSPEISDAIPSKTKKGPVS